MGRGASVQGFFRVVIGVGSIFKAYNGHRVPFALWMWDFSLGMPIVSF